MESAWRLKFPNGRLVIIAGSTILLRDIPNPFQTDGFPYAMWKDYDVGTFWGQGEGSLKDCQIGLNRIASEIYNILQKVGNPSYKVEKGAGVNVQSIKNKPGFIIPMDRWTRCNLSKSRKCRASSSNCLSLSVMAWARYPA